jgi:hypothetical protein
MRYFRVKADYQSGMWLKDHPCPVIEVRAANAKEAAEFVCGASLQHKGRVDQYRAQVWQ